MKRITIPRPLIVGFALTIAAALVIAGLAVFNPRAVPAEVVPVAAATTAPVATSAQKYRAIVTAEALAVADQIEAMTPYLEMLASDPSIIGDDRWQFKIMLGAGAIKRSGQKLKALAVPAGSEEIGDLVIDMGDQFDRGGVALDDLLETENPRFIDMALQHFKTATVHLEKIRFRFDLQ